MISRAQVQQILNTLPIGYYTKKNIPVTLEDTPSSYCDIMNQKIVISYTQLQPIIEKIESKTSSFDLEESIRCMLYHEVSHAFLTPKTLEPSNIINIFEDERIETLLKKYYKKVNFKKFVVEVNDFHNEKPVNVQDYFYQIVRYRIGKKKLVDKVNEIIKRYANLNLESPRGLSYNYMSEIRKFYNDVEDDWWSSKKKEEKTYTELPKEATSFADSDDSLESKESEKHNTEFDSSEEINDETLNGKAASFEDSEDDKEVFTKVSLPDIAKKLENKYFDKSFDDSLKLILSNIRSNKNKNSSAINSYSGIFDPRSTIREDYKFFVQKNRLGNVKQYSKMHLNLFIDVSGSFFYSEDTVNQMLYSLLRFEKIEPSFSFDLVTMEIGEKLQPKNERRIECNGGNYLDKEIFTIYNKLQLKDAINYNIVLFDGDALTDVPRSVYFSEAVKNFKAFDHQNTTIISSNSNKSYLERANCNSLKKIFTDEYSSKLKENILNTLQFFAR